MAKVIAASVSPHYPKPLVTFELRYWKAIHGEFMTHRVLSRNASSSRAVPVARLLEEVRDPRLRADPIHWGAEQRGMQSGEQLDDDRLELVKTTWDQAARRAADYADNLVAMGLHKSIANRLLEPFSHINVVATATEWDNFFGLRLDRAAQPEMRALAEAMWTAYDSCEPRTLRPGQWHLPYTDEEEGESGPFDEARDGAFDTLRKISVARCARVSYRSLRDPTKLSDVKDDLNLYDKLLSAQPLHASPAEHQATPDTFTPRVIAFNNDVGSAGLHGGWANPDEHGNLVGWRQFRKMLPGEACAPLPEEYRR